MSEVNPYQAPESSLSVDQIEPSINRERLKKMALAHRRTNLALLMYLLNFGLMYLLTNLVGWYLIPPIIYVMIFFGLMAYGAVQVFKLVAALKGVLIAILFIFLLIIPIFGLLSLLIVSSMATRELKRNGIKVGFLGAKLNSI